MVATRLATQTGDGLGSISVKSKAEYLQAVDAVNTRYRNKYLGFIGQKKPASPPKGEGGQD